MNRRQFVGVAAGAAAASPLRAAASDAVVIGIMGIGGRGTQLTEWFSKRPDVRVAWVCDAQEERLNRAASLVEKIQKTRPRTTGDFRRILEDKTVDAMVNATPEHWHAVSTIMACQAGKDVYVEKAASQNIWEGRKVVEAARKYKRVVQVGMQTRSAPYGRSAAQFLQSGKLGRIQLVRVWNLLKDRERLERKPDPPTPKGLDWDMWTGPVALHPYNPIYMSRHLWEFEGGNLTNNGVHQLDLARWVLGLGFPKSVQHSGGNLYFHDAAETPDTQAIAYEYDRLTVLFELTEWTPYMKKIPQQIRDGTEFPQWYPFNGTKIEIYGSEGMMILGRVGGGWQTFLGPDGEKGPQDKSTHIQMQLDHVANFVSCVRTRERPNCDIEEGHISAALCHMANISYRVGNIKLEFDAATERFRNSADANRLLRRETYRQPWVIPDRV